MERTTQTVPNVHPSYVARMDELQHELEVTQMDNCQLTVENDRLKEVEKNLRDQLHDCERDSYRLESQLEKAYEKQDHMRSYIRKLKDQASVDTRKIIQLQEEVMALHHIPRRDVPPAFADDDQIL